MMEIRFDTGNACFRDPDTDELDRLALAEFLRELGNKLGDVVEDFYARSGSIMEINGNRIGDWILVEE